MPSFDFDRGKPWQENYEHGLVPAIFGPWSTRTLALAVPKEGENVLDIACGTGVITRLAARSVGTRGRVIGLDVDPGMIEVARVLPVPEGTSIEWTVGDAQKLPFPDASFDLVFCQGGLQFIPDRLMALHEMHRVLRSGGRLALMVGQEIHHCPGFAIFAEALDHLVGWRAAALLRLPFTLGDAREFRSLLVEAGFQDIIIRPEVKMIRFPSPATFVERMIRGSLLTDQMNEIAMTQIKASVSLKLQPFVRNDQLSFPMGVHLADAHP